MRKFFVILVASVVTVLAAPTTAAAATYGPLDITVVYNGRCLDAHLGAINQNGTPVQLWDCLGPGQLNQQWYVEEVSYYSEYRIINAASGRCLDAHAGLLHQNGTPVQLWDCLGNNQWNQIWQLYWDTRYHEYIFRNKASGRVLDAHWGAIGQNGTPVQLWDNYGDLQFNQRWRWLDW